MTTRIARVEGDDIWIFRTDRPARIARACLILALAALLWGCKSNVNRDADRWDVSDRADADADTSDTEDADASDVPDTSDARDTREVDTGPYVGGQQDDPDEDGVINANDNCKLTANPEQLDSDGDLVGDACDNCDIVANADQQEVECEGICPEQSADDDGDGVPNAADNCPSLANTEQNDADGDMRGDACDNCPQEANHGQGDADSDGVGDACEEDPSEAGDICYQGGKDFTAPRVNMYFALDASATSNFSELSGAMDVTAGQLADLANIGVMTFGGNSCGDATEHLAMGDHTAAEIQSAYASVQASGDRPAAGALQAIKSSNAYELDGDSDPSARSSSVILVMLGEADACGAYTDALTEVEALSAAGVSVYVVAGFGSYTPSEMSALAQAGGTDDYYEANSTSALLTVFHNIARVEIGCTFTPELNEDPVNSREIWASIDRQMVPNDPMDGFTFNANTNELRFHGAACKRLVEGSETDPASLQVWLGCQQQCFPESEQDYCTEPCDRVDNDCDGTIDEHCQVDRCAPEVCDRTDNDCDGVVDNGCPTCTEFEEPCTSDEECCTGFCSGGVCKTRCAEPGSACRNDRDCCYGECYLTDGDVGFCAAD